jgi:hypothetical protein
MDAHQRSINQRLRLEQPMLAETHGQVLHDIAARNAKLR